MTRYDSGYHRTPRPASGDWANPGGGRRGMRSDRYDSGYRPWVGGYREGYQGGSSGVPTGRGYYAAEGTGGGQQERSRDRGGYGGDYWWLGERAYAEQRSRQSYDEAYRRFNEQTRPRFSPVGGNYHAMGGEYQYRRPPGPLREERWFSDWTRWF
jgi:hypothetical protein